MAKSENTTEVNDRLARDVELAKAFRDLEPEIADIRNMALCFEMIMENVLPANGGGGVLLRAYTGKELPEGYRLYALTAEEYDPLDFAMHQLTRMIDAVHDRYYAALEGEPCT